MVIGEEVILNATSIVPVSLDPLISVVRSFFAITSTILGGLFGLYFVFLLLRYFNDRKVLKELKNIKHEIASINYKLEENSRSSVIQKKVK